MAIVIQYIDIMHIYLHSIRNGEDVIVVWYIDMYSRF
jgi:hypothetical protein